MTDRFDYLEIIPTDFSNALAFYRDVLGWQVLSDVIADVITVGSGRQVLLSGGSIRIMLRAIETANRPVPLCSGLTLHLDIHDARKRFADIPPGAHIVKPPSLNEFGELHFVLRDPDGSIIVFNELRQRS